MWQGSGRRDDPFVLPRCTSEEGVLERLRAFRDIEKSHGNDWQLLELTGDGPGRECVRIQRRVFTEDQVITDRIAFHFDVSAVEGPSPPHEPFVWRSSVSGLRIPNDFAWLHFDTAIDNTGPGEPEDISVFYSGCIGRATLYVYGRCDPADDAAVEHEAASAFDMARGFLAGSKAPWPARQEPPFHGRFLIHGDDISYVGVAAVGGQFVKLRLTLRDVDDHCRRMGAEIIGGVRGALLRGTSPIG
jgi:hypothetical protein